MLIVFFGVVVALLVLAAIFGGQGERPRPLSMRSWVSLSPRQPPRLEVAGRPAELSLRREGQPDTVLRVPAAGGDLRIFESARRRPGETDLVVGDPEFDRAWVVQGVDVPRFFSPESKADVVAAVNRLMRFKRPRVSIGNGGVELRVKSALDRHDDLRTLVGVAEVLVEVLRARADPTVVVWMESREDGDAVCQICGAAMTEDVVRCAGCATAHHADCWAYLGRCSIYGCGRTECRPA